MNIALKTYSGHCIVRPDTTWERDNEDVFLPEFVHNVTFTPVFFIRIDKPGRSIGAKFASRYYTGIGYGVLLYPENMIDSPEGFAAASCVDHTSFLPFPVYNKATLGQQENEFILRADGKEIFRCNAHTASFADLAIEQVSKCIYLRTGDILAVELAPRGPLASRQTKERVRIEGSYCQNVTIDFNVVL